MNPISLIAWMSSKLGESQTESRSWLPKWPTIEYFFLISGKLGQIARPLVIEQNVQFQVAIYMYHEKLNLIKFKMANL